MMIQVAIRSLQFAVLMLALPVAANYLHFESDPVRPLAMSPDGSRLYVTNISDNRLEIFDVTEGGIQYFASVPVGLEPVAVAARSNSEVWVVNHLSDSISIVDVTGPPRVARTLLVADEPRDIVFAGPSRRHAYVTTARRGQNSPVDPMLSTEGVGRANVWVFDADNLGEAAGGEPHAILTLFGDKPRALAVSPDGTRVYAGIFHSGNQTVALNEALTEPILEWLIDTYPTATSWILQPQDNYAGIRAPITGRIVQYNREDEEFQDVLGNPWNVVPFTLPDYDVFEIDAASADPVVLKSFPHVGTIVFNLAVNPANGVVYATNGDANNMTRFEGPGIHGGSTVRGNLHRYRITTIEPESDTITARPLNPHIDYDLDPETTASRQYKSRSLATPLQMVFNGSGEKVWLAAMGSNRVAALDTAAIESGSYTPDEADHITITGGGPAGLVYDDARNRLYVYSRFANSVSVVDVGSHPGTETSVVPLVWNAEPAEVQAGRQFLYDAGFTSSNGEASCSSCHIFAGTDHLSWDLGNPDGDVLSNFNEQMRFTVEMVRSVLPAALFPDGFFLEHHPMKGPMFTQSLRGLDNHGPMHWRGDRSAGKERSDPASTTDEDAAFKAFNVAFEGLLGNTTDLSKADMQAFTDFTLAIPYPPNPVRNLDNQLDANQENGRVMFEVEQTASGRSQTCNDCHVRDVEGGKFGTSGQGEFDALTQMFKVPHLRNLYDRIGMFGVFAKDNLGPQIRGSGFSHDGFTSDLFLFVGGEDPSDDAFQFPGDAKEVIQHKRNLEAFLQVFDTNLAPIVGQQVTLTSEGLDAQLLAHETVTVGDRIDLFRARAMVNQPRQECDLIVKGRVNGKPRGWVMNDDGSYTDSNGDSVTHSSLIQLAEPEGQALTFTCTYPGAGSRMGIDRDTDGLPDATDEVLSNPDNVLLAKIKGNGTILASGSSGADGDGSIDPIVGLDICDDPDAEAPLPAASSLPIEQMVVVANPGSNLDKQSFMRFVNRNDSTVNIEVYGIDDRGVHSRRDPISFSIPAQGALQMNAQDLENGNAAKGLTSRLCDLSGKWQLRVRSDKAIDVFSLIRTTDGLLTSVNEVVPASGGVHKIYYANPADNSENQTFLRMVNNSNDTGLVTISGFDDTGKASDTIAFTLGADESKQLNAVDLENGNKAKGAAGALGDGSGLWRLNVSSELDLKVQSLVRTRSGFLINLSGIAPTSGENQREVLFVNAASQAMQSSLLRLINTGESEQAVTISAVDDKGDAASGGDVTLTLDAHAAVQLTAADLENGNEAKGLAGSLGEGQGRWRLTVSGKNVEVMSLLKTPENAITNLSAASASQGDQTSVLIMNPASNLSRASFLRISNNGDTAASISITGFDDQGFEGASPVTLTLAAGTVRELSAVTLEEGGDDVNGALGDGAGKWRLEITSSAEISVQSLLQTTTGFLTNLSR